jgi:hypothetical protein
MVIYKDSSNDYLSVRVYFGIKTYKNENDICNEKKKKQILLILKY